MHRLRSLKSLQSAGVRVRQIACGHAHTLLLTDSGEVWSCGRNEKGQCGQDTSSTRPGQCDTLGTVEVENSEKESLHGLIKVFFIKQGHI